MNSIRGLVLKILVFSIGITFCLIYLHMIRKAFGLMWLITPDPLILAKLAVVIFPFYSYFLLFKMERLDFKDIIFAIIPILGYAIAVCFGAGKSLGNLLITDSGMVLIISTYFWLYRPIHEKISSLSQLQTKTAVIAFLLLHVFLV